MIQKIYHLENLDCANCAAKIEKKFNDHEAVQEAVITFSTKQLRLTAEDPDALIPELTEIARTVEGEVLITPREEKVHHHHHHDHECCCGGHGDHACGCGHHDSHEHACSCGHYDHSHEEDHGHGGDKEEKAVLLLGAAMLLIGLRYHDTGAAWFALLACLI